MKYLVYKDPWHGRGHFEVRTDGDVTVYKCTTRDEAKRVAHALNTKPARRSIEDVLADLAPI
jgi:hypothetical protein